MKFVKKIKVISADDYIAFEEYLKKNSDRKIQDVFNHIRSIPVFKRSKVENLVFTYLYTNRKKLGIK